MSQEAIQKPKKRKPRKSPPLTLHLIESIAKLVSNGIWPMTAAKSHGVLDDTFKHWLLWGRLNSKPLCRELVLAIEEAKAKAEIRMTLVADAFASGCKLWQQKHDDQGRPMFHPSGEPVRERAKPNAQVLMRILEAHNPAFSQRRHVDLTATAIEASPDAANELTPAHAAKVMSELFGQAVSPPVIDAEGVEVKRLAEQVEPEPAK